MDAIAYIILVERVTMASYKKTKSQGAMTSSHLELGKEEG